MNKTLNELSATGAPEHLSTSPGKRKNTALLAAMAMSSLLLVCPSELMAQDIPDANPVNQQPGNHPLGINPEEKNLTKIRDAIKETVAAALPPDATVERVLVANDYFDTKTKNFHNGIGVHPKLFARLHLNKGGKKYVTMDVFVMKNEKEAALITQGGDFPHYQRIGNITILFTQHDRKGYDNEFLTAIGKGLGIPPETTLIKVLDAPLGLDLNETDRDVLIKSVIKRVTQALPEGTSVAGILFAPNGMGIQGEKRSKELGVPLRMYSQLSFRTGDNTYPAMEILKVDNEEQVEKIFDQYVFPYAQRVGNIIVIFDQKEDVSDYDTVVNIAKKLGLSRQLK